MDKKFLERHNLTESQKRFQRILEYVQEGGARDLGEAEDDQNPQGGGMPPQAGGPDMGGGMPGGDPMAGGMPGADPMGGGAPGADPMGGGAPGADPMGGDQNAAPDSNAPQGVDNFNPQVPDPSMGDMSGGEDDGEDVEEVDVDELVDTQDETKAKVAKLDGKIDALIQMINKFESDIDANNAHIDELKQEFEKRNPTQVEKMTLRAKKGYPFAESPDEYWDKKEEEGEYSPEDDNNGEGDERYAITKNDVDNITDWDSIYKSIGNGGFHQDLKSILNF